MFILGVIRALTELAHYNIFPIYNIYFLTALQFMHDLIYISWPYFVKKRKEIERVTDALFVLPLVWIQSKRDMI